MEGERAPGLQILNVREEGLEFVQEKEKLGQGTV